MDFASRVDQTPRTLRLIAIAERDRGKLLPDARLDDEDWQDWYPLVDRDGYLTGEIIESDAADKITVDWCPKCRRLETWGGACDAAVADTDAWAIDGDPDDSRPEHEEAAIVQ